MNKLYNEQIVHELLKKPKQTINGKEVDVKEAQPPQNARGMMPWGTMAVPVGRGGRGTSRGRGGRGRGGDWNWSNNSYGSGYGGYGSYGDYYGGGYGSGYGGYGDYYGGNYGYEAYDTYDAYSSAPPRAARGRGK